MNLKPELELVLNLSIKPDLATQEHCLIDFKYKILQIEKKKKGLAGADLYQMYAYALSQSTKYLRILILMPENEYNEQIQIPDFTHSHFVEKSDSFNSIKGQNQSTQCINCEIQNTIEFHIRPLNLAEIFKDKNWKDRLIIQLKTHFEYFKNDNKISSE